MGVFLIGVECVGRHGSIEQNRAFAAQEAAGGFLFATDLGVAAGATGNGVQDWKS